MRKLALIIIVALGTGVLHAGETGKLSGTVLDTETGEALVGANVVIVGTTLGAAADESGFYFVNKVPPGDYQVQVSLVGYQTVRFNDVRVMADVTTELNATLSASALELGTVEVTAERRVVQRDRTSTRAIVSGETIVEDLRFQDVDQVVQLQAGVTRGVDGALHIRGGRTGGTVYQVDGIPLTNPFTRTVAGQLEVESVQELQAQLGTFDAEYGNAADGVISVYTKDGGDAYSGKISYESPNLNSSPYHKGDWNLDREDVRALPPAQQAEYLDEVRKPDGTSAYEWMSVLDDRYARDLLLIKALGTWTATLSGPVPLLNDLKFFATGRLRQENSDLPFGYTIFRSVSLKLTYPLSSVITFRASADVSANDGQDYNHQYKYWRWWDSGMDPLGRRGGFPITRDRNNRQLFSVRHVLSPSTFYDFSAAHVYDYFSETIPDRTVVADPGSGSLVFSDYVLRQWVNGNDSGFRYGDVRYWTQTESNQYLFKGNLESQVHKSHQIRTGFEVKTHKIARHQIGMPTLPILEFFTYRPVEAAAYLQDKIEYSFMILKVGVRVDYFNPRATAYPDPARILTVITNPDGTAQYQAVDRVAVSPRVQVSPRIGIAHPISDKTSIHFAYGHFFQIPRFYDLYRNDALQNILVNDALIGNPGLKPEKTVSFEIGLQQEIARNWGLNVTAYSKDITNLTSSYYYFFGRDYSIFTNTDFARVQGIDITLNKSFSDMYAGRLTYSLTHALGNQSDPTEGYTYREDQANLRPNRNYYLDFDQRHKINATITTRFSERFGPEVFGIFPFEQLGFSAILTAGSGLPYTPTSRAAEETGIVPEPNSARRPWVYNLDLKFSRWFRISQFSLTAFLDIENVFDAVNTVLVWTRTGEPWDEGPTSIRTKDRQSNPANVGPRRSVRIGAYVEF